MINFSGRSGFPSSEQRVNADILTQSAVQGPHCQDIALLVSSHTQISDRRSHQSLIRSQSSGLPPPVCLGSIKQRRSIETELQLLTVNKK